LEQKDQKKSSITKNNQETLNEIANTIADDLFKSAFKNPDNLFFGNKDNNEAAGELYRKLKRYVVKGKYKFSGITITLEENRKKILDFINTAEHMKRFKDLLNGECIEVSQGNWDLLYNFFQHVAIDYEVLSQKDRGAVEVDKYQNTIKGVEEKFSEIYGQCSSGSYDYSSNEKKFYGSFSTPQAIIRPLSQSRTTTVSTCQSVLETKSTSLNKQDFETKSKKRKTEELEKVSVNTKQRDEADGIFSAKKREDVNNEESYKIKR
jgi:hypothetical protein